jgi:hypothetical protein
MLGVFPEIPAGQPNPLCTQVDDLNDRNFYGHYGHGTLADMNRPQAQTRSRIFVALRSSNRATEVCIQISWRWRISGPAVARLLIIAVLVLAATALALPAHEELARDALYSAAGLLAGVRPRIRS